MKEKIILPYAPILVESTRSIGYSFESALADIIDNSISKNAKEIHIRFNSTTPQYVAVIDDACGMNQDELISAMRYGSKSSQDVRDANDLGRFGLGLKMASLSQCRKLTVITKQGEEIHGAQWDLDYIITQKDWALKCFDETEINNIQFIDELKEKESGTVVLWELFDRMLNGATESQKSKVFDEKIEIARNHISLVFHRFTGDENPTQRVNIYFNNEKIEPIDPFLSHHPATQPLVEQTLLIENSCIKVKPYILPYASKLSTKDKKMLGDLGDLRQNQGFYVYRNKRLIIWGTWFRLIKQHELNKLARVRVDIPNSLDSLWEIDIKKSAASLPDIIKKNLVGIVENTVGRSERVYRYRGRKVSDDDLQHIWNPIDNRGCFQYLINRDLPLYKKLEECLDEEGNRYLDSLIKTIEDAFPYGDVYFRLAKSENPVQTSSLEFDEVYKVAADMIQSIKEIDGDIATFISSMDKIDFFIKYPEVVDKIKEDYSSDG